MRRTFAYAFAGALALSTMAALGQSVQRAEPGDLPPAKSPSKQATPKAAATPKSGVKSQEIAPSATPKGTIAGAEGAAKAPPLRGSLGAATTGAASAHAKSESTDPAYEAFDQGKYLTALDLAQKAAAKGDPQAHTLIARIHLDGLGVAASPETAAKWYAKGAELGDIESAFGLGVLNAQARGMQRNYDEAARLFEIAAIKGHVLANYNLGLLFLRGQGKAENPARAFRHIEYAAERGVAAAQYDLGTLYTSGTGTEPNAYKGAQWIGRAARAGFADAEVEYATILFKVDAPDANDSQQMFEQQKAQKQGAQLFRSAAEKGVPIAQNRLARCYLHGLGVEKDQVESAKWYLIAREAGVEDEALEAAVKKLSRANREKAEKAAEEWREKSQVQ